MIRVIYEDVVYWDVVRGFEWNKQTYDTMQWKFKWKKNNN